CGRPRPARRRRRRTRARGRVHDGGRESLVAPASGCGRRSPRRPGLGATVTGRREELAAGLEGVRARISHACDAAGRSPDEVTLVVVTKFFPASDVRLLAELGVTDVGENRHQEAEAKARDCADLGLRWHFVGGLQSNKAAAVAAYADVVESVDRPKLLAPLARGAGDRVVQVLLQVSLDA